MFQNVSEGKNLLKSYVIFPTWYRFHTKQKFQTFFKSCSRMSQKPKMNLKLYNIACMMQFKYGAEISILFYVMLQNVWEHRNELKSYVIYCAWCSFLTKQKIQHIFKSCWTMFQKTKMDWKVTEYSMLDVVIITSRNFNRFLSHVWECLRPQKWN